MKQLSEKNLQIEELLKNIDNTPSENESSDELVSNLLVLIGERQILLDNLKFEDEETERKMLEQQISIGKVFEQKVIALQKHIQSLLQARKKNQRQINVYQSIDSNK
ncbi:MULTISPECIES: hypothetical protein [Shewanella]|uniref:Flagella biosynthesis chaperone for FliD, FliT n=1 Tax=Shewanella japonica TaxID=93973 RepID=A0ABM6JLR8_9GAMM|nr:MULTISPECIES: hypothetical protein [Shewanella]ARD23222.1 hypothetical protein SJ2017_2944 [Shewanella japonica]KPZ69914.1 hypothetical protein AN944_02609 [Shewanella sp. P1-14-1]MBQ4891153.1 hypothetical protein [Shewanella sp. MMG014]OBT10343.1 hypothetical protein A9267_05545 [Shewanella sp. UCD-FRSSP16_17]